MATVHSIGLSTLGSTFDDVFVASVLDSGHDFHQLEVVGDRNRVKSIKDCIHIKPIKFEPQSVRKSFDSQNVPLSVTKKESDAFLSLKD